MSRPLVLVFLWLVLANVIGMLPSRRNHWPAAYVLIAVGIPLLAWLAWESGPIVALFVLVAGASVLRWPLIYLWRWLRGLGGRRNANSNRP